MPVLEQSGQSLGDEFFVDQFALPYRYDPPSRRFELLGNASITSDIPFELRLPKGAPSGWHRRISTSFVLVPKAPMHENHGQARNQHNNRLPRQLLPTQRKRKPIRCNKERTRFSGRVSRLRMRLMFQLRCSGVRRSIELCPATNETDTLECVVCAPAGKFDCPPSLSTLLISAGRIQKSLTLYILFFYRLRGSRCPNRV